MMGSMAGFVFNDAVVKIVAEELALFQIMCLRGAMMVVILGVLVWRQGAFRNGINPTDRARVSWRTLAEILGTICFLTALFNMPIANVTAILQALPLAVTLTAAWMFGEKVGWRRYLAIAIGFFGMLIIIRPGAEGFSLYSIWAVAALAFIVMRDMTTRDMARDTQSVTVAWVTAAAMCVVAGTGLVLNALLGLDSAWASWSPVSGQALALLLLASVFLTVGYLCAVATMRVGDIGFVAPFRYTILIWAILLGYFVFGDVPDFYMLLGSAIIVATGVFTFYRERLQERRSSASQ